MRLTALPVFLVLALPVQPTAAEPSHSDPTRDMGVPKAEQPPKSETLRAEMLARQEAFHRHIAERSDLAIRSICVGCAIHPMPIETPSEHAFHRRRGLAHPVGFVNPVDYLPR